MKIKMSKAFTFLMALVMIMHLASVAAFADGTKVAAPSQVFSSSELSDEALLELGYVKVQVVYQTGADIFESLEEDAEPVAHLDAATELWVKKTTSEVMAEIYNHDKAATPQYILLEDVVIILKKEIAEKGEEKEEYPARGVTVYSSLYNNQESIQFGDIINMEAVLENFRDDDECQYQWFYSSDGRKTYIMIDGANQKTFDYALDIDNYFYSWRVVVTILNEEVPEE